MDVNGNVAATLVHSAAGLGAAFAALVALSIGDWQSWWESAVTANGAPAPAAGTRQSVADRAVLLLLCADNTQVAVLVPAPGAIFLADGETVDPANGLVAAFVAAATGVVTNAAGSPVTGFIAGHLLPKARAPL